MPGWMKQKLESWLLREISISSDIQVTQQLSSVQFSRLVMSDSLRPHRLQHVRPPCLSPTLRVYIKSCPLSWWCHPTISSCHPLLLPPSVFPSIRVFSNRVCSLHQVANVLELQLQHQSFWWIPSWFPLELIGLLSLQSKGLSRVFSNTTVQKHQFFSAQLSLWSNSHIHTWLLEKP